MLNKKIFFIFLFAFVIRLIALNQSLWLDEAVTANVIKHFNFIEIITKFSPTDFHPPLYYLFMKIWTNIFGYSEIALRMPSILFSLGTGWVIYLIGGGFAATLFLFNPLIVYYSQEARTYMMATFLLTTSLYFFLKISNARVLDSRWSLPSTPIGGGNDNIFLGIFISLAFLTFYGSAFLITAFLVYFLYKKQYRNLFICLLVVFVYFLTISPLLYQQLINSKIVLSQVANWSLVLGKANIKNLLLIPIKFSIGRISFNPKIIYWIVSGIWSGLVFWKVLMGGLKNKQLLFLFIFPLILGFLVSFYIPMLQYFRFLYLIPIASILLGYGLSGQASSDLGGQKILVGGFLIFTLAYLLIPQFHREDWKGLVNNLPKNVPVYMILSSSDPVKYYSNTLTIKDLSQVNGSEKEIVIIPYTAFIHGLDYKSLLSNKGYLFKKETSFREVAYEQWLRK